MCKMISILLCLCLCACATKPVDTTLVPISVPCKVETPAEPNWVYKPPYSNLFDAVRDLLSDRQNSIAYQTELKAALKSCK